MGGSEERGCGWRVYEGDRLRCVALPLGGLGTGTISICGDGSLRQWEVVNYPNHGGYVPLSFFAIWIEGVGAKLLQSRPLLDEFDPGVMASDHRVPRGLAELVGELPTVRRTKFVGEYPFAFVEFADPEIPVGVELRAFSPFIPLNSKDSALPVIFFTFILRNSSDRELRASVAASLLNFVGWDNVAGIDGFSCGLFCGNFNKVLRREGYTAIVMRSASLERSSPRWGEVALAVLGDGDTSWIAQWGDLDSFWRDFSDDGVLTAEGSSGPSGPGRSWCGSVARSLRLRPGEEASVTFVYAWFFPNRYVDWRQGFSPIKDERSRFWIGNMYSRWFGGVEEVLEYVCSKWSRLVSETEAFHDAFWNSDLPYSLLDRVAAGISVLRSPTCFWSYDGYFYGFEGCLGASTRGDEHGGCCPLNCTHVWNYEQTLSRLFPDLERKMREIEFLHQQHPSGYIPHRTVLPLYLPRPWDRPIGGPEKPALDGMLGAALKAYREYSWGAGKEWLARLWPRIKLLMDHVLESYELDDDHVIWGEQPNTYDISVFGANTFIGTLYLAALKAVSRMAAELGDRGYHSRVEEILAKAGEAYDRLCWNGEYYIQVCDRDVGYQWYDGCLSDQLLGQWWSHVLDLGYVLPRERVRKALRSIVRYNWRSNFRGFRQAPRVFAHEEHSGLLNCTWPRGGRPRTPILYCDEVWTGIEYEVAALLLYEGLVDEAMKIVCSVRGRYDGSRMNPWNEVECGDHYVRSMSSWTLLEAALGYHYHSPARAMRIAPRFPLDRLRAFLITPDGWGRIEIRRSGDCLLYEISCMHGTIRLRRLRVASREAPSRVEISHGGEEVGAEWQASDGHVAVELGEELSLDPGEGMLVKLRFTDP